MPPVLEAGAASSPASQSRPSPGVAASSRWSRVWAWRVPMIVGAGWGRWARCTRPHRRSKRPRGTSTSRCPDCYGLTGVLDSEAVEEGTKRLSLFVMSDVFQNPKQYRLTLNLIRAKILLGMTNYELNQNNTFPYFLHLPESVAVARGWVIGPGGK